MIEILRLYVNRNKRVQNII